MTGPLIVPKDSYPVQGDLNKVISYETQREIFLSKKKGGRMSQPIDIGGFAIENLPAPTAIDHAVNKDYVDKNFIAEKGGVMRASLSMNKNDLIGLPDTPAFGYSAVNKNYVTSQLNTKLDKAADIDMKNKKITALITDSADTQSATNVGYVKNAVNVSETNIITTLTDRFDQKIKESHISSSTNKKDVFRYLMEDADESSSEHDIIVEGITDFSGSPHEVNKKAYSLKLGKGAQNEYFSRIGFNMFQLLEGEYTLAIEFFPPSMTNVSVDVVSTSLNIGQQATKLFPNYSRSIVHLHKWSITPPEYIYIDLKCQGTASSGAQGTGYLIVYSIKGSQNDVDSAVYDKAYAMENGKMVMQTDIDINGYKINSPFVVTDLYNKTMNKSHVFWNGGIPFQIIPFDCHLIGISFYIHPSSRLDFRYTLQMKNSGSLGITKDATQNASKYHIVLNERLEKGAVVSFDIFRLNSQDGPTFSQACFSFVFSQ